jgi:DNA polymerase III delta subunit
MAWTRSKATDPIALAGETEKLMLKLAAAATELLMILKVRPKQKSGPRQAAKAAKNSKARRLEGSKARRLAGSPELRSGLEPRFRRL